MYSTSHALCSFSPNLPNITKNLSLSGEKTIFWKIQDGGSLKLKKNVRRPDTREAKYLSTGTYFDLLWRAAFAPGDGQTSPAYSSNPVQYLYINRYVTANKLVLSYLLLRFLPPYLFSLDNTFHYLKKLLCWKFYQETAVVYFILRNRNKLVIYTQILFLGIEFITINWNTAKDKRVIIVSNRKPFVSWQCIYCQQGRGEYVLYMWMRRHRVMPWTEVTHGFSEILSTFLTVYWRVLTIHSIKGSRQLNGKLIVCKNHQTSQYYHQNISP